MLRRIFAWVSLIGFVLLIINLLFFRFLWEFTLAAYIVIVVVFLLTNNKSKVYKEENNVSTDTDNKDKID